jgi:SIR2-like domain
MSNFFDRAMELYKDPTSPLETAERRIFGQVFDYRKSLEVAEHKILIDPENIEELFGLVEMAAQLNNPEADAARKNLIYVILRTLELTTKSIAVEEFYLPVKTAQASRQVSISCDLYELFVNLAARRWTEFPSDGVATDAIISLNYDLLLERAMEKKPPNSNLIRPGFRPAKLIPMYGLPPELTDESEIASDQATHRIRLFKLHGSANWAICRTCGIKNRVAILSVLRSSMTAAPLRCDVCKSDMTGRLIVPPAWNKEEYIPALKSVWAGAAEALVSAQRIWIIGYSMPDADKFFRYLLAVALQRNRNLDEVIVVNSSLEDCRRITKTFRALDERNRVQWQQVDLLTYIRRNTFQSQLRQFYSEHIAW